MKKILISEFMDATAVDQLARVFAVDYAPQLADERSVLEQKVASVDALIVRNRTQVDAALLSRASQLKVVGRLGVGLDNIRTDLCAERAIEVIPARGANALAVAEYALVTAAALLRGAYFSTDAVAAGQWPRTALSQGREAAGKTFGVVGFGSIGQETARLARALAMPVMAYDPMLPTNDPLFAQLGVTAASLDTVMRTADVVSLHVPLNDATRHLVNAERLATMKPSAVLINTARGGIVDEAALADALRQGRLGGAALDVFEEEPLPAGSPLVDCPRLLLTPHIAGVSVESNERVSTLIAEKVAAYLSGESS